MRLRLFLCILGIAVAIFSWPTQSEAATESNRYIALHDRMVSFQSGEVRMVNGQMVVPFEKMARYLYADIVKTEDKITVTKNNISISYNFMTNETIVNESFEYANPVQLIDDILYIPIRFFGESTGFKVDYLSDIVTARLYTSDYPHMSHPEFTHKVKSEKQVKTSPQPAPSLDKSVVYLTFDDGPNLSTAENLRILKEYGVKGTFFFVGSQINHYKLLLKQTHDEGHYIGLHSMTHNRNNLYSSSKAFIGEMQTEDALVQKLTGHSSVLVRAPYGSSPYVTPGMRDTLRNSGYKLWDWDVDTVDWQISTANYQKIVTNVKNGVRKSHVAKDPHIVVLLHDRPQTTKALPAIIKWLQDSGFLIKTYDPAHHVSQNFGNHKGL
jgi:peptidoglycan-N-acetylglucosamine deacetylase